MSDTSINLRSAHLHGQQDTDLYNYAYPNKLTRALGASADALWRRANDRLRGLPARSRTSSHRFGCRRWLVHDVTRAHHHSQSCPSRQRPAQAHHFPLPLFVSLAKLATTKCLCAACFFRSVSTTASLAILPRARATTFARVGPLEPRASPSRLVRSRFRALGAVALALERELEVRDSEWRDCCAGHSVG